MLFLGTVTFCFSVTSNRLTQSLRYEDLLSFVGNTKEMFLVYICKPWILEFSNGNYLILFMRLPVFLAGLNKKSSSFVSILSLFYIL